MLGTRDRVRCGSVARRRYKRWRWIETCGQLLGQIACHSRTSSPQSGVRRSP